ncbi:hypothetical protein B0H63DRAFT_528757 [Podospora didyma]|uniref:Ubiquitin-like domain-containing protein n=1 Tax=Podospora didyma TaxID=330526 RepID=A0AAE0K1L0_9PEZI|nr:hypothetical protein B0H63DRAFT_528757 [Podospora didyma]
MAEAAGAMGSIIDTIAYASQLATQIQTCAELTGKAGEELQYIGFEVMATASALRLLNEVIEADKTAAEEHRIFNNAGVASIKSLAADCEKLYSTIVVILRKACTPKDSSHKVAGVNPNDGLIPLRISISQMRWSWLSPRVTRCWEQLRWLEVGLLIHLKIAHLAELHVKTNPRPSGAFEKELDLRVAAGRLRNRQLHLARKYAKRQAKANKAHGLKAFLSGCPDKDVNTSSRVTSRSSSPAPAPAPFVEPPTPPATRVEPPVVSATSSTAMPGAISLLPPSPPPPEYSASVPLQNPPQPVLHSMPEFQAPQMPSMPCPTAKISDMASNNLGTEKSGAKSLLGEQPDEKPAARENKVESKDAASPEADTGKEPTKDAVPESAPVSPSSKFSTRFSKWIKNMFGSADNSLGGTSSQELEAYTLGASTSASDVPLKVPFGQQELKVALKKAQKGKKGSTWYSYVDMTAAQRRVVSGVANFARHEVKHERTCIGMEEHKKDGLIAEYLIFFSLPEPQLPVLFKCAVGRKFSFPYEHCKNYHNMRELINEAYLHVDIIGPHVLDGHFDLVGPNGELILPSMWNSTIRPGDAITMHMWPLNNPPPPRNRPRFGPPPGQRYGGPPRPMGAPPNWPRPDGRYPGAPMPPIGPPPGPPGRPMFIRPPGAGGPPPGFLGVMNPPPPPHRTRSRGIPPPQIIDVVPSRPRRSRRTRTVSSSSSDSSSSSTSSDDSDVEITREEEDELCIIDFERAAKREPGEGNIADMLRQFTNVKDVGSDLFETQDMWNSDTSSSSASTVSVTSTTSSL